ncbi:hypothetical protein ACJRO7_025683 [Eucalyptus globulus]|uniref:Histidine-containing phosphotransfer protein n=1 Tax=Eucalyptus globulus TaxID=34317 RepID=A0ABD3K9R6_EUCGL
MDRELSDYRKMEIHLKRMMGGSSSIGAKRVRNVCIAFRSASRQSNHAGCLRALELLEQEYCYLNNKPHELFQLDLDLKIYLLQENLAMGLKHIGLKFLRLYLVLGLFVGDSSMYSITPTDNSSVL